MSDAAATAPRAEAERASTLALRLAHAENALLTLTSGQVDAIVTPEGEAYLLRPAQAHLRQNERRLQAILDSAPDVITVLSRSGHILSQNGAVGRVLGRGPGELVGSKIFSFVHEEDLPRFYSAFFNVAEELQENATVQFRHQDRNGWRPLEATVGRLHEGHSDGIVMTFRHPYEPPKELAAPALRAQDPFLAMLSHELRTPLLPILMGVQELQEDERFTEARPVLEMIRRNAQLQVVLLEELADFVGLVHQKVRLHLQVMDAHEAIRFVLQICESEIAAAKIKVALELRAAEFVIVADPSRFQQALWNLVKNAVKFSPPRSRMTIGSDNAAAGYFSVTVTDEGAGIARDQLPLVFDSFQQGSDAQQSRHGGLGLGLFIAKGMTEAQQGSLTASSDGVGRGAAFRLRFKVAASQR